MSSSYELQGKLAAKFDVVQRSETFKTREFVIEKTDDIGNGRIITNFVKFQCVQDRTSIVDRFNVGDEVKVSFNLRGTKWEKNGQTTYITNLDAWRVESFMQGQGNAAPQQAQPQNQSAPMDAPSAYTPVDNAAPADDLPF